MPLKLILKPDQEVCCFFIVKCEPVSHQVAPNFPENVRYYGKDAPCPEEWNTWLNGGTLPFEVLQYSEKDILAYHDPSVRPFCSSLPYPDASCLR